MAGELAKLLQTAPENSDKAVMAADLSGFRRLFDNFVTQPGPNVVWDKIEPLPNNSVRFENMEDNFCKFILNRFSIILTFNLCLLYLLISR